MKFGGRRREDPRIDVTPMIDVVFQLLLFFMVTTTFVSTPGIDVELPKSSADVIVGDDEDIDLVVTLEGAVWLGDQPVTWDALSDHLRTRAKRDADTMVVVKAHEGVSHGRVVAVMDLARSFGLTRIAIATATVDNPL